MLTRHILPAALGVGLMMTASGVSAESGVDFGAMSGAEREAFRSEVRAYLLENPEVIFEAIQILEQRRADAAGAADSALIAENAAALFDDGFSPVLGNPDGDVTVVEFLDHRCGYCKRAHPEILALLEQDQNVRVIVKEFPILGPESVASGRMALAANEIDPSLYAALNDALMTFQGQLTEPIAYRIAAEVGYDIGALKTLASSDEIAGRISANYELAQALRIEGTPSFVIGDSIVRGFVPAGQMLSAVETARASRE